jgi:hypothetical protein
VHTKELKELSALGQGTPCCSLLKGPVCSSASAGQNG